MAHLEIKSRGCHGSARTDIVLKRRDDKHRADVPRTVIQAAFGTFTHEQPNTSALEIDTAWASLTLPSKQKSGAEMNQNQKLVTLKDYRMLNWSKMVPILAKVAYWGEASEEE